MAEVVNESPWLDSQSLRMEPPKSNKIRRRLIAAALSVLVPGLGQWLLGARQKANTFFAALLIYVTIYLSVRVPNSYLLTASFAWLLFGICCWAASDALFLRETESHRAPWWTLIVIVPFAFVCMSVYTNLLVRCSGFRNFNIPTSSMENTIMKGDQLMADLRAYRVQNPMVGEIVLFRRENFITLKRVIAVGPAVVAGRDGEILVNGRQVDESHAIHFDPGGETAIQLMNFGPITVPEGTLFVVGDNRDLSLDSRIFGPIQQSTVIGKAIYILRPLSRGGTSLR